MAAHGIKSYVFESLRPTPELSFAVRHYNAIAGIMVTASHNPKEFNGYKVYGEDGGQMPPADADALTNFIRAIDNPFAVELADLEASKENGLITVLGEETDVKYLEELKDLNINPELIAEYGKDMKIVYTPLHGTGEMLARRALAQAGFESVQVVEAQATADPDFSTVASPNPESQAAFALQKNWAVKSVRMFFLQLTLTLTVLVLKFVKLTVHTGTFLVTKSVLSSLSTSLKPTSKQVHFQQTRLAKSIVSTELVTKIAESYGATMFNVLTGFKFIAEKIQEFEEKHNHTYMFGFEESFGYLIKPFVRDKDLIQAVLMVAEIAYYRSRGMTLADGIDEIFKEYGYFAEKPFQLPFLVKTVQSKSRRSWLNSVTIHQHNSTQRTSQSLRTLPFKLRQTKMEMLKTHYSSIRCLEIHLGR